MKTLFTSISFLKSAFCTVFFYLSLLAPIQAQSSQDKSLQSMLSGEWKVTTSFCSNFLLSEDSTCPNESNAMAGQTYQFVKSDIGMKMKRGVNYYPVTFGAQNDNLLIYIDMKMFKETWFVIELRDNLIKVVFFTQMVSFEEGPYFNGDFHHITLSKIN